MAAALSSESATSRSASAAAGSVARPKSSGVHRMRVTAVGVTSITSVGPKRLTSSKAIESSSPTWPDTTTARAAPSRRAASASGSRAVGRPTPITCTPAPAGLQSGPTRLKTVGRPSDRRSGPTCAIAGWWTGARQKQSPSSARHRPLTPGDASTFTPSRSSTSAEPVRLETARLPCLATGCPAAATTMPAAVEMLKEPEPSPPVPQVSATTPPCHGTGSIRSRRAAATPAMSAADSPRSASATSQSPNVSRFTPPASTASTRLRTSSCVEPSPARSRAVHAGRSRGVGATEAASAGVMGSEPGRGESCRRKRFWIR